MTPNLRIWHVGNWCIHIGQKYVESPFESPSAMPKLLGAITPHGFLGLLVAGMLAASMSTYSAYLLAWSSVATRDVIACLRPTNFSERTTIWLTRLFAGLIGTFLLVFGLWYQIPDTAFQYLFITGAMYTAGALGCVAAGIYWRRVNTIGAYCALIMGALAPAGFLILEKWRGSLPSQVIKSPSGLFALLRILIIPSRQRRPLASVRHLKHLIHLEEV